MLVPTIAVIGAPFTGKRQLAAALGRALQESGDETTVTVTDVLAGSGDLAHSALTLLTGLEEASLQATPAPPEHQQTQLAADLSIRAALDSAGIAYRVIYGTAEQRLAHALEAAKSLRPHTRTLASARTATAAAPKSRGASKAWVWTCEKCSDPVCEHRLLSDLLAQRTLETR
ncbi:hypothetical protein [Polaromonas sp.]|uniref:hypothetical protein n=1 Tax=Polaromonas sp. TaxID=1869339 RepID=UPI003263CBA4